MKHYTICCIIIAAVIIFFGSSAVMAEEQDGEDLSGELISGYSELYGEQIEGGAGEICPPRLASSLKTCLNTRPNGPGAADRKAEDESLALSPRMTTQRAGVLGAPQRGQGYATRPR